MYSKREVCFTLVAALAVWCHPGPQNAMARGEDQCGPGSIADGTHPPPPAPPQSLLGKTEMLQADGTHPPPPPPPPQPIVNTEILQADGTHPPPPPWLASAIQAG